MLFNRDACKASRAAQSFQFIRLEAPQDRERTVCAYQAIMQKQAADRRVEIISDRIAVKINNKDASTCDSAHLTNEIDYPFISKMMSEQRADRIVELAVEERKPKRITANRTNLRKLT